MTGDQKRAIGIGAAGVGGFLLWRRSRSSGSSRRTTGHGAPPLTNAGASGSIAPYTPQSPLVLSPGESIYDPNSEALLNTPTSPLITTDGTTFGPGGEQVLTTQPQQGPQATTPAAPSYVVNVNYPKQVKRTVHRKTPTKRKVKKVVKK